MGQLLITSRGVRNLYRYGHLYIEQLSSCRHPFLLGLWPSLLAACLLLADCLFGRIVLVGHHFFLVAAFVRWAPKPCWATFLISKPLFVCLVIFDGVLIIGEGFCSGRLVTRAALILRASMFSGHLSYYGRCFKYARFCL